MPQDPNKSVDRPAGELPSDSGGIPAITFVDPDATMILAPPVPRSNHAEQPREFIGTYQLIEPLGEGGFGTVWRAEQREPIHREVALKVIKLGMDSREIIARFESERQTLALMDHPNIAAVLDASTTDNGRPFFVMELVKGVPITDYCDAQKLSIRQRLELFIPVCQAVQHAHQKSILHRDLKPSNILVMEVDGKPVPKVIDFGIAKALHATDEPALHATLAQTLDGMIVGTPQYMSPEQAGSVPDVDTRSDIYTLGVILYELLVGETPLNREQVKKAALDEVLRLVRESEPRRPSLRLTPATELTKTTATHRHTDPKKLGQALRGDLDWIVLKTLEKDRARRYDTANDFALDLRRHLNNEPVSAGPPSTGYRLRKLVRRNQLAFGAASAILVMLIAGITVSTWQAVRATKAEKLARESLSQSDFFQALRSINEDRNNDALAQQARSLSVNPQNDAALCRLTTLLTYRNFALPVSRLKHDGRVQSAQFSPDGKRIATASWDKTARVWDAQSGQPLTKPMKCEGDVQSAQFSPDGKWIVTAASEGGARVWDAQSGQPLTKPMKCEGDVQSAQFSPDGKWIVTTSSHPKIGSLPAQIWDAQSGQPLTGSLKHGDDVWSTQFSPDGKWIVTASGDEGQVWDAQSGRPLTRPMKHDGSINSAQFSPDGKWIVTASDDNTARVWDAQSSQPLTEPLKHASRIWSAQFSPEGKRIVTAADDNTARVWDAQSGQPLTTPLKHEGSVYSAQFSPDGKQIVTAAADYTARVWDAQSSQPLTEPLKHEGSVYSAQFSPDGKQIVTASDDNTARVWDAQSHKALTEPLEHDYNVQSAEFSPDGKRIVTASEGGARVWDAQNGQPLTGPMKHNDKVYSAQFSPEGKRIVTAAYDKTARVWDAQSGKPLTGPMKHDYNVQSAKFSPDGKWIVTAAGDEGRVWDAQSGKPLTKLLNHDHVMSAEFSPDGKWIVTASYSGTARVWNAQNGEPMIEPMNHDITVKSAEFSPDGKRIVTVAGNEGRVWDAQSGRPLTRPMKHDDSVNSAHFSLDGKWIVTASYSGTARVWDAQNGKLLTTPMKHASRIWSAQFSSDGKRIVTASDDNTARIWDALSGQPLTEPMEHEGVVHSAQFSPDGKQIVTASEGGARVWDISARGQAPKWLPRLAEAVAGKHLNDHGVFEPLSEDPGQVLKEIRAELNRVVADDDWAIWGRWFLADRSTRTISPFSKTTVPQYIENRIKEKTPASLDEAERLAVGNAKLLQRIAQTRNDR